jgi:hypothetical protein
LNELCENHRDQHLDFARRRAREAKTHHESIVIRSSNCDTLESVDNNIHQISDRFPLIFSTLLELSNHFLRDLERSTELDDGSRTELVSVEVGQPDGNDLKAKIGMSGNSSEGHDRDTGFKREEVGTVVRSSFGEDTDASTLSERLVNR